MEGGFRSAAGVAEGADAARQRAVESAEGHQLNNKRKSFSHQDPEVITIGMYDVIKLACQSCSSVITFRIQISLDQIGKQSWQQQRPLLQEGQIEGSS